MTTITKEQVHAVSDLKAGYTLGHADVAILQRLARIALAAQAAGPVYQWRERYIDSDLWDDCTKEQYEGFAKHPDFETRILYTAPPTPVSDEDLLHMAASAIDDLLSNKDRSGAGVWADIPAKLRRAAMLQGAEPDFREISKSSTKHFRENAETSTKCWCQTCRPVTIDDMRFVVCPECGNKRCPHANDHKHACTKSNEPGQEGSAYPAAPQQEE